MPGTVLYIAVGMLFLGVLPMPYGYYTLLRFVAFLVFLWAAFVTYERKEKAIPWVCVFLAILFNPIIKIYFPKEIWSMVDFASAVFLLCVSKKIIEDE